MLEAGVGKAKIVLTEGVLPVEHFTYNQGDLFSRVILLKAEETFVFVSLDVTSLQNYAIDTLKDTVYQLYPVSLEHIFISVTHTFSAPHTRSLSALEKATAEVRNKNQHYLNLLKESVKQATQEALAALQSVILSCQYLQVDYNLNRDVAEEEGYWLGKNSEGYSNKAIPVLKLTTMTGQLLGMLYSVDVQSSIMEKADSQAVSSDFIGLISQKIEMQTQSVALCMFGAGADQVPNVLEESMEHLERLTSQFAEEIAHQVQNEGTIIEEMPHLDSLTVTVPGQVIPDMKTLKPTKEYTYLPSDQRKVEVTMLTLGELAIIMMKPEITSIVGKQLQDQSPYQVTMVATMINGGQKYMADQQSYQRFTYEAMNSMFGSGSAELVCQETSNHLKKRKDVKG